jgi:hypothetical protein
MRTEHQTDLTLFCLTDTDCADIPGELDFRTILENIFTTPSDITTPDLNNSTPTSVPIPNWPDRFVQADYTHTLVWLYAGLNAAWAFTCLIVIGKWKERAVRDSCWEKKKKKT